MSDKPEIIVEKYVTTAEGKMRVQGPDQSSLDAPICSASLERIIKLCEAFDNQDIEGQDAEDVMAASDLVVHQICEIAFAEHARLSHQRKPTRVEIEAAIKAIADDCAFTMPIWMAGMLQAEVRRQRLTKVEYDGTDFRVSVRIKQSPRNEKRPGAAGAQMQGRDRDMTSQQPFSQNEKAELPGDSTRETQHNQK